MAPPKQQKHPLFDSVSFIHDKPRYFPMHIHCSSHDQYHIYLRIHIHHPSCIVHHPSSIIHPWYELYINYFNVPEETKPRWISCCVILLIKVSWNLYQRPVQRQRERSHSRMHEMRGWLP